MNDAETELIELFKNLGETRKNNPNCYRHDIFEKWQLADLNSYPQYTWQWNLTRQEYKDIKSLLSKYSSLLKETIQNRTCCKLLQIYVSEWYKREYNGYDKQGNAFESIRITNISEEICRRLGVDENVVYHESSGDCRWRDTIYVDGGLPLYYLKNNQNSAIRKTIEDIIESNAEGTEFLSDDLGDLCGNQVVNQSYKARIINPNESEASIYDFIQDFVIRGNLEIDGFEEFTKLIQETNDKQLQKKIEVRYKVFKTAICFQLIPQLFFRKEPNDVRYAISQERLNAWGVHPQDNRFVMEIKAQQRTIWNKEFTKCLRGDYIAFPKLDRSDIRIEDCLCLQKWDVFIDGSPVQNKALYNALREKGYVQMYSIDGFSWYSQSSNNYNYSAVLFDRTKESSLKEDDETNIIIDGNPSELFGWKQIDEMLCFTINDKKTTLFNRAGELFVEPKEKPLSDYYNDKKLYLVYMEEKPSFDVVFTKEYNGEIVSKPLNEKEYNCEVKYGNNGSFVPIENSSHCGYAEVRITHNSNDQITKTIRCFFIPKKAEIRNITDVNNRRTDFKYFNGLNIRYNDEQLVNDNGVWKKYWGSFSKEDYHCPEAKYQVTDGVVSFELAVEKPLDATVVKKKTTGSIVGVGRKEKENRIKLPILVLDRVSVHQLPNNTLVEIDKVRIHSYAFKALIEYNYREKYSIPNTYLDFQTFTHTRDNFGDIDLGGLSFAFVPTSQPMNYQTLSLNKELPKYGIDSQEEGIVVQCIDGFEVPKVLLEPIYIPGNGNNLDLNEEQRRNRRNERINRYHEKYEQSEPDYSDALSYFEIAVETGMYFGAFDALLGMMRHLVCPGYSNEMKKSDYEAKHLVHFYEQYVKQERRNYKSLWRMADELLFDWCLIPQSEWNKVFDDLTPVKELIRHRHHQVDWLSICLKDKDIKDDNQNIILRTITGSYKGKNGRNSDKKASFWNVDLNMRVRALNSLREINNEAISKYIEVK